jgi:hypothetical protein
MNVTGRDTHRDMSNLSAGSDTKLAGEVVAWRRTRLCAAGFPPRLAGRLADDCRYDLHALIELTERACPPELAARILEPLEIGPGRC